MENKYIDKKFYLSAAKEICRQIEKQEIRIDGLIGYIGRTRCVYDGTYQIGLYNNSIYDGIGGICVFYMALYHQTKDVNLLNKAHNIFTQICKDICGTDIDTREYKNLPISPLTGLSGVLYIMESFDETLFHEPTYLFIIDKLRKIIPVTEQYDYMSGITGLICFLYQAKHIDNKTKTELLQLCGKRLLELCVSTNGMMCWKYLDGTMYTHQKAMFLGGYAHGSASISLAMYMLYLITDDKIYKKAMEMALKHDRSFFSVDIKGWVDGRNTEYKIDSGSWCHGSAGIALSRLQLMSLGYKDSLINEELSFAKIQMEKRLDCNLSICHGSLGNLEILHILQNFRHEVDYDLKSHEENIITNIINKFPLLCGDDNYDSLIGLFMGKAGFGYQLLRMASWKDIPSVMCLETNTETQLLH